MRKILEKVTQYWVPVIWGFAALVTSANAFGAGDALHVICAIINLAIGLWAAISLAKRMNKKEERND